MFLLGGDLFGRVMLEGLGGTKAFEQVQSSDVHRFSLVKTRTLAAVFR